MSVLVWVSPTADSEARVWVQEGHLSAEMGGEEWGGERGKEES